MKPERKNLKHLFVTLFSVSLLFPVVASVQNTHNETHSAAGIIDVSIAASLLVIYAIFRQSHTEEFSIKDLKVAYDLTSKLAAIPLLLILLYFLKAPVNWEILLIGIGWRFWLLIACIPYLVKSKDTQ